MRDFDYVESSLTSFYLRDPDGNGVELYWDRPKEQWPRTTNDELAMTTEPLDLNQHLREGLVTSS